MVRLPGPKDIDEYGRVTMAVKTKKGMVVKKVSAPDAREIIYADSGTLELPSDLKQQEAVKDAREEQFNQMGLDSLRELCKENAISYTGKPPSQLRRLLLDTGVEPRVESSPFDDEGD